MRGDDRPRESRPSKKHTGEPPAVCAECRLVYTDEVSAAGKKLRKRTVLREENGEQKQVTDLVCTDKRDCRQRSLTRTVGRELGKPEIKVLEWLWIRFPRDLIWQRMDIRLKQEKWRPRWPLHERVLACILYHSWCYPVCMPYAVQLAHTCPLAGRDDSDPDAIVEDRYHHPVSLRQKDIARILREHDTHVSRAVKRLMLTTELRVDEDGRLAPAAKLLDLSVEQRLAIDASEIVEIDQRFRAIPKGLRWMVAMVHEKCADPDLSTGIFQTIDEANTAFRTELSKIRTVQSTTIREACLRAAHLIPDLAKVPPASSRSTPLANPQQSPSQPPDDAGSVSVNQLYEAGMGEGALAKLPPKPREIPEPVRTRVQKQQDHALVAAAMQAVGPVDDQTVRELINKCRIDTPDCTGEDIARVVQYIARHAREAKFPAAYLKKAVPTYFTPDSLERLRGIGETNSESERARKLRERMERSEPPCPPPTKTKSKTNST